MIKVSDLWAEVKKVAAEQPDYVYQERYCQYQHGGKPSCIVGHALHRLGVSVEALKVLDEKNAWAWGGIMVGDLPKEFPDLVEEDSVEALFALEQVQEAQDNRIPWGEAVGGVQRSLCFVRL